MRDFGKASMVVRVGGLYIHKPTPSTPTQSLKPKNVWFISHYVSEVFGGVNKELQFLTEIESKMPQVFDFIGKRTDLVFTL